MPVLMVPQIQVLRMAANAGTTMVKSAAKAASHYVDDKMLDLHTNEMTKTGGAGVCLPSVALQVGDIIVSTTDQAVSSVIKVGTMSSVSHAALFIGHDRIIDATGVGVKERSIAELMSDATHVVAFRHRKISYEKAQLIVDYALGKEGSDYDTAGALIGGASSQFFGNFSSKFQDDGAFYCSELVVWAFNQADVPIDGVHSEANTPSMLPRSADLEYVGHLKV